MNRKVDSLYGVMAVQRVEVPPSVVFALIPTGAQGDDGIALTMETFVHMEALPQDLRLAIMERIPRLTHEEVIAGMSEATRVEMEKGR